MYVKELHQHSMLPRISVLLPSFFLFMENIKDEKGVHQVISVIKGLAHVFPPSWSSTLIIRLQPTSMTIADLSYSSNDCTKHSLQKGNFLLVNEN